MFVFVITIFACFLTIVYSWDVVTKSKGSVWPLPQEHHLSNQYFSLDGSTFQFVYNGTKCQILDDAFARYMVLIFKPPRLPQKSKKTMKKYDYSISDQELAVNYGGQLNNLEIVLSSGSCEVWPYLEMHEKYELKIDDSQSSTLISESVWGLLRGLETFSHLTYRDSSNNIFINVTSIADYPRFEHRGVMLDTSRHYVPKSLILKNLDAMTYSKYNVFHWHIVDDQSFPYQSTYFPSISEKGAYNPATHIYTVNEIVEIIDYARQRGIRVLVEFDTPGHTSSWGAGIPGLLTQCYKNQSGTLKPDGYGPINPTVNFTYIFLQTLFAEVTKLFPDNYIHVGGDEVPFDCWQSNPEVAKFMEAMGYGNNYTQLESYYITKLLDIVSELKKTSIVWQEVYDNNVTLDKDAIVHVWKDNAMSEMKNVTSSGYRALLSTCWYLSDFQMANDWITFYPCEPLDFNGTEQENDLVLGGEACLWGEYVDSTNLISRLWPRALAPAERLWSNITVNDHVLALPRFEEHRCRMVERGINAEPVNGPSWCPSDYLV